MIRRLLILSVLLLNECSGSTATPRSSATNTRLAVKVESLDEFQKALDG